MDNKDVTDETGRVLEGPYKHLRVMERRRGFLDKRIKQASKEGRNLTHDVNERDALQWAIDAIYQWVDLPERE